MSKYNKSDYNRLKYKFEDSELIEINYSQAFQDMFVLSILNGKKNGTYIEIGGDHPIEINNTYLLEKQYWWSGFSFEFDRQKAEYYNSIRKNRCICKDATTVDYEEIFSNYQLPNQIDYLQVDIEPSWQTLKALKQLPLDKYRFSVITFETDLYMDGPQTSQESHELLTNYGYELLIKNVAYLGLPFENWYVDPNVVDKDIMNIFRNISDDPKEASSCILNN